MKLKLKTLSPVNIGTGQNYGAYEFIRNRNELKRIHLSNFLRLLDKEQVKKISKELENNDFSLNEFVIREKVPDIPARYSMNYNATSTIDSIREQIKTNNIPYIPGSSIKGAIRTAILWKYLRENASSYNDLKRSIENTISKGEKPNRLKKNIANYSIDKIFGLNPDKKDAKFDLLKFVEISDFMPDEDSKQLEIEEIKTYSIRQDGTLAPKHYSIFSETLFGSFEGTIRLSPQIKYAINDEKYPLLKKKLEMIGLTEDYMANLKMPEEKMIQYIRKCLSEFNNWAIEKEIMLCESDSNFTGILEKYKNKDTIRIGFSVGTTYQTMIKLIEETDSQLFYKIINRLELHGHKNKKHYLYEPNLQNIPYPKTIEFTESGEPLGWLEWS